MNIRTFFNSLTDIPTSDPDDSRRRKLLNILLLGMGILTILILLTMLIVQFSGLGILITGNIWLASFGMLVGLSFFYFINRNPSWPGWISSSLFLLFLLVLFLFVDTPQELAAGRSLFILTIPIIMASILLNPISSFLFAFFASIELIILANIIQRVPNACAIFGFFLVALVSWLSARSLEQALHELREINVNLDRLVDERTQELARSLSRELVLAGRNQAILESITDGVIVFDTQGTVIQANPALSNLINIPFNNIINATVTELVDASPMDAKNKGTLAGLLTNPGKEQFGHRIEWGKKTISISSGQVFDREGGEVGVVAIFHDFTKEAELEKMKSAFVAMVSHELRTPLSAILGYAEIFKEHVYGPLNEKQDNMIGRIISNSRRLLNLINDLLDQAQMEAGKLKIKYENFRPAELLDNLHSDMDKLTTDKGLALKSELDQNMPETLVGDSARLQQILVNLVNNAVKFTDEGLIHVAVNKLDEKQWGITVTDTGKGIPQEELPYIFDTFRQVEGTTIRVHGGFGLGLSIVKQLVNLMGGQISVESELEKGSTFSITLPLEMKGN